MTTPHKIHVGGMPEVPLIESIDLLCMVDQRSIKIETLIGQYASHDKLSVSHWSRLSFKIYFDLNGL